MSVDTSTHLTPSKQSKHHFLPHAPSNSNAPKSPTSKLQLTPNSMINLRKLSNPTSLNVSSDEFKHVSITRKMLNA